MTLLRRQSCDRTRERRVGQNAPLVRRASLRSAIQRQEVLSQILGSWIGRSASRSPEGAAPEDTWKMDPAEKVEHGLEPDTRW